jgi:hypothetical protein
VPLTTSPRVIGLPLFGSGDFDTTEGSIRETMVVVEAGAAVVGAIDIVVGTTVTPRTETTVVVASAVVVGTTGTVVGATGVVVGAARIVVGATGTVVGATRIVVGATGTVVGAIRIVVGATGTVVGVTRIVVGTTATVVAVVGGGQVHVGIVVVSCRVHGLDADPAVGPSDRQLESGGAKKGDLAGAEVASGMMPTNIATATAMSPFA